MVIRRGAAPRKPSLSATPSCDAAEIVMTVVMEVVRRRELLDVSKVGVATQIIFSTRNSLIGDVNDMLVRLYWRNGEERYKLISRARGVSM